MIKLRITLEDSSELFLDIDQEWLEYILDYPNSDVLLDSLKEDEELEKANNETLADMCEQLGLNSVAIENKLITKFKAQYGKDLAKTYMQHIL